MSLGDKVVRLIFGVATGVFLGQVVSSAIDSGNWDIFWQTAAIMSTLFTILINVWRK